MAIPSGNPEIPMLTTEQMREVDRLMVGEYKILLIQMMENAGRNLAHLARRRFLNGNPIGRSILVLVGTGGNGGGGLVCARRLHNWGAQVHVLSTAEPDRFAEIPLLSNTCNATQIQDLNKNCYQAWCNSDCTVKVYGI